MYYYIHTYISRSLEKFIYIVFNEYIANYQRDRNPIHVKNNTLTDTQTTRLLSALNVR